MSDMDGVRSLEGEKVSSEGHRRKVKFHRKSPGRIQFSLTFIWIVHILTNNAHKV